MAGTVEREAVTALAAIQAAAETLATQAALQTAALQAAVATRKVTVNIGAVAATGYAVLRAPFSGVVTGAAFTVHTTIAAHNDDHWTFLLVNKGAAGAGTANVIAATSVNSTDANASPAGAALTGLTPRALTLGDAADLAVVAGDVLLLTMTKAGSAAAMVAASLEVSFQTTTP